MEQATNPIPSMDATFLLQQAPTENGVAVDAFSRQLLNAMKSFRDGDFSVTLRRQRLVKFFSHARDFRVNA